MDDWRHGADVDELIAAILRLEDPDEAARFLRDLCTLGELRDLAQRWAVVRRLDQGEHYAAISRETGRQHRHDHPDRDLAQPRRGRLPPGPRAPAPPPVKAGDPLPRRTRVDDALSRRASGCGLPSPTRAAWSSRPSQLLRDAGLVFEEHERSLVARVRNFDLDILFVRTNDVIEFVGDGVADLGITGEDLLAETGAELPRLRSLGYGQCRLAAAVPADSPYRTRRRARRPARRDGPPEHDAAVLRAGRGIPVDVISISGAVEVAPRLGLAEAIVDLVSTGSTLVMNGLRPIADVLASEAILSRTRRPRSSAPRRSPRSTRCSAPSSPPATAST